MIHQNVEDRTSIKTETWHLTGCVSHPGIQCDLPHMGNPGSHDCHYCTEDLTFTHSSIPHTDFATTVLVDDMKICLILLLSRTKDLRWRHAGKVILMQFV